jgi:kexin
MLFRPALFIVLVAFAASAAAQSVRSWRAQENGTPVEYDVAADELDLREPDTDPRSVSVPRRTNFTELKTEARARRGTPLSARLVLYPTGAERTPRNRRVVVGEVLVFLKPGASGATLTAAFGTNAAAVPYLPGAWLVRLPDPLETLETVELLRGDPAVDAATAVLGRLRERKSNTNPTDVYYTNQWHLLNRGQSGGTAGIDVRASNVWANYRGTSVLVGIVDDGVETSHKDLAPNYSALFSYDWVDGNADPNHSTAAGNEDGHGTCCAGLAVARGDNNATGVVGVAYRAGLAGLRLLGNSTTDSDEAGAINFQNGEIDVKSNSWGPGDDGNSLSGPEPLMKAALENAVRTGRGGRGVILTWAGGNGGDLDDNSNYDGYANSPWVFAIGAMNTQGRQSWYSEDGANLLVVAPSSDAGFEGMWTTDRTGNEGYNFTGGAPATQPADRAYNSGFGGTSAATPVAAGVCALVLDANPNLGWRDMREILIRSAQRNHSNDADWATNGAGFAFNHKYGAGLISASGAVALATAWTNLAVQTNVSSLVSNVSIAIPDNNYTGTNVAFDLATSNLRVESALLHVGIDHDYRGDLDIRLVSPSGMTSILAERHGDSGTNYSGWRFHSVRHYGEDSAGTWRVVVRDTFAGDVGSIRWMRLELLGTRLPVTAPVPVTTVASEMPGASDGNGFADPGETITESLVLGNLTNTTVSGITAVLSTTNPGVTLLNDTFQLVSLAGNARATGTTAFAYRLARTMPPGSNLVFSLITSASGLPARTTTITRAVGRLVRTDYTSNLVTRTVNVNIPDAAVNRASITNVSITITNTTPDRLDDVQCGVRIDHKYLTDLSLTLRHPDGTEVPLVRAGQLYGTNLGTGSGGGIAYTWFSDQGQRRLPAPTSTSPYVNAGGYLPTHELSNLRGKWDTGGASTGTWNLIIRDHENIDSGTNRSFRLVLFTHREYWTNEVWNTTPVALASNAIGTNVVIGTFAGFDADDEPLTFNLVTTPTQGLINYNSNTGEFTWDPLGFDGTNFLEFTVSDGLATSAAATVTLQAIIDTDLDGLPNAWEGANGLDPNSPADAELDLDGDGQSNRAEYLAGTAPNDANDALRVVAFGATGSERRVTIPTADGRIYQLQTTPRLDTPWTNAGPTRTGTGVPLTFTNVNSLPAAFYRVILTHP